MGKYATPFRNFKLTGLNCPSNLYRWEGNARQTDTAGWTKLTHTENTILKGVDGSTRTVNPSSISYPPPPPLQPIMQSTRDLQLCTVQRDATNAVLVYL